MGALVAGDRVRLVHTSDEWTRLRPGALGTVTQTSIACDLLTIDVDWDDGSRLSMIPDSGDRIEGVLS